MAMEEIKTHPVGMDKELIITGSMMVVAPEQESEKKIKKAKTISENYTTMDLSTNLDLGVVIKVEDGGKKEQAR